MSTTVKPLYAASSALTVTNLQTLASDTNLLAGWMSAVQDNTTNLYDDWKITGTLLAGTTPTVSTTIEVWLWEILDDTPTYPDTITGSEGTVTLTSINVKNAGAFKQIAAITIDATSNRSYPFTAYVSQFFGGNPPKKWGVFIVHNTAVALKSSGQVISITPIQYQNV